MSLLPDYRQATPEFTSTASSSTGERWYQDPPTPEGESSNARYAWDLSLVYHDQPYSQEHHGLGLLQDQIQTGANALESGKGRRGSVPHPIQGNVGSEQFPYESASATGLGFLENGDSSEFGLREDHLIRWEYDGPPTERLHFFPLEPFEDDPATARFEQTTSTQFLSSDVVPIFDLEVSLALPIPPDRQQHSIEQHGVPISPVQLPSGPVPRNFDCPWCYTGCARQADLDRHMQTSCRVTLTSKRWVCKTCEHRECRKDKIQLHCQRKHKQARGKEGFSLLIGSNGQTHLG